MKIAIIQFGGSNCDMDVLHIFKDILNVNAELVWYKNKDLSGYDGVVLPGGFSYGDYLRSGAIASRTPIMDSVKKIANEGKPVLGICNGFQILTEASLLDGALMTNSYPKFICDWTYLKVENNNTIFTSRFNEGEVIKIPVAHKEGNYYNTPERLNELNNNHQVAFRYVNQKGHLTNESNPNGSVENIAGITNSKGNVLGLMPHPERAAESILGSKDGLKLFLSMVDYFSNE